MNQILKYISIVLIVGSTLILYIYWLAGGTLNSGLPRWFAIPIFVGFVIAIVNPLLWRRKRDW